MADDAHQELPVMDGEQPHKSTGARTRSGLPSPLLLPNLPVHFRFDHVPIPSFAACREAAATTRRRLATYIVSSEQSRYRPVASKQPAGATLHPSGASPRTPSAPRRRLTRWSGDAVPSPPRWPILLQPQLLIQPHGGGWALRRALLAGAAGRYCSRPHAL